MKLSAASSVRVSSAQDINNVAAAKIIAARIFHPDIQLHSHFERISSRFCGACRVAAVDFALRISRAGCSRLKALEQSLKIIDFFLAAARLAKAPAQFIDHGARTTCFGLSRNIDAAADRVADRAA